MSFQSRRNLVSIKFKVLRHNQGRYAFDHTKRKEVTRELVEINYEKLLRPTEVIPIHQIMKNMSNVSFRIDISRDYLFFHQINQIVLSLGIPNTHISGQIFCVPLRSHVLEDINTQVI